MGLLCGLVGVAMALFVVALIGHGLWTLGAHIIGATSGSVPKGNCPACAKPLPPGEFFCNACGFQLGEPRRPTLADDLEATKRQVIRLANSGVLSGSSLQDVLEGIRRDDYGRRTTKRERAVDLDVPRPVAPAESSGTP
ncbi:MAG TPA: hypothetical protein VMR25_22210, partial [Planctomycetaceae bacterium]|nr:hypothetical protein [Planctomycetaceae bacterium]